MSHCARKFQSGTSTSTSLSCNLSFIIHEALIVLHYHISLCEQKQFSDSDKIAASIIKLYPDKIPNEIAGPDTETKADDGIPRISNISRPTLTIYLPSKEKATGAAVVICPGGGYGINAYKHEGTDVAELLVAKGIAAFILKYRLPSDKIMKDKSIGPLQDAQQAIRIVRQRAKEWNVNPSKIGIAGFSAGGHLASTAGTHFQKSLIDNPENTSVRPDFMILLYPVISFTDSIGHIGSRTNLLGKAPSADMIRLYSNELQVTSQLLPPFLCTQGTTMLYKLKIASGSMKR